MEMSLHVLAYNLKRIIAILGVQSMTQAIRAACVSSRREQGANPFPSSPTSAFGQEPPFRTSSVDTGPPIFESAAPGRHVASARTKRAAPKAVLP